MTAATAGVILLLSLPFLLSLLGKAAIPKMLCLVASLVAALLAVKFYLAIVPWLIGMAIAAISVREGLCSRTTIQPKQNAAGLLPPRTTLELAGPGLEAPRCQAKTRSAGDPSEVTALGKRHWITSFRC
jgi:hypothetical protein